MCIVLQVDLVNGSKYLIDAEEYWWPESPYRLAELDANAGGGGWFSWLTGAGGGSQEL